MYPVYYYDKDTGTCPVRENFAQYTPTPENKPELATKKKRVLAGIVSKIKFVAERNNNGVGKLAVHLQGYSFSEVKSRKDEDTLIRIMFFRYEDKMVLLDVIEKPDSYNTEKERSSIKRHLDKVEQYQKRFISDPKSYEEF